MNDYPMTEFLYANREVHLAILILKNRIVLADGTTVSIPFNSALFLWEGSKLVRQYPKAL